MTTVTYTDPLDLTGWATYQDPTRSDQQGPRLRTHVVADTGPGTPNLVPAEVKSSTLTTNADGSLELVCEIEPASSTPGPDVKSISIGTYADAAITALPGYASGGMMLAGPKLDAGQFLEWEFSFSPCISGIKCACGLWTTGDTKAHPELYFEYDMFECSAPDRQSMFVTNHWYDLTAKSREQSQVPHVQWDFTRRTYQRIEWDAQGIRNYIGQSQNTAQLVAQHTDHLPTVPMSLFMQTALSSATPAGKSYLDIYALQIGSL